MAVNVVGPVGPDGSGGGDIFYPQKTIILRHGRWRSCNAARAPSYQGVTLLVIWGSMSEWELKTRMPMAANPTQAAIETVKAKRSPRALTDIASPLLNKVANVAARRCRCLNQRERGQRIEIGL